MRIFLFLLYSVSLLIPEFNNLNFLSVDVMKGRCQSCGRITDEQFLRHITWYGLFVKYQSLVKLLGKLIIFIICSKGASMESENVFVTFGAFEKLTLDNKGGRGCFGQAVERPNRFP